MTQVMGSWHLGTSAVLGAFVLYMLYRHQDRQPFSLFLALNIKVDNAANPFIVLADMFVSALVGGVAVTLLTTPMTTSQAFAAGLGMTGIFSAHLRDLGNVTVHPKQDGGNTPAPTSTHSKKKG